MRNKRSKKEIEADKWIWNHNRKIRKMGLIKREEEKLLVPSKSCSFFGKSEDIIHKAKPKKKNVDLVQFIKKLKSIGKPIKIPEKNVSTKLDDFYAFMNESDKQNDYYKQLGTDLEYASKNLIYYEKERM